MTIYLDVVFFQNILMNSIILLGTGLVIKVKCKIFKILISSILGASYVIGIYMTDNIMYSSLFIKALLSFAMVYVAFSPKSIKLMVKYTIIFYLTSFVFGGCAFALLYFVKPQEILYKNGYLFGTYPIKIAFLGAILGLIILIIAFKLIKSRFSKNDMFCNIEIFYHENQVNIRAIIDTGNLLRDPITSTPVIVVQKSMLTEIISKDILDNIQNVIFGQGDALNQITNEDLSRFRLIPFSSLGKQNGMLIGFKPDYVIINSNEDTSKKDRVIIRYI